MHKDYRGESKGFGHGIQAIIGKMQ